MIKQKGKAFSLVELIVVITILVILGAIAFTSLQGYSKSARDSARISDISNVKTALELFSLQTGYIPEPSQGIEVTFSGSEVWTQGTLGDSVFGILQRLDKKTVDPLTGSEYSYSRLNTKKKYEIALALENNDYVFHKAQVSADSEKQGVAYLFGNYNSFAHKLKDNTQCNILALPSIVSTDLSNPDIENIVLNNKFVYNGYHNLPASYGDSIYDLEKSSQETFVNNVLVYSGTECPRNDSEYITVAENLHNAYSGTSLSQNLQYKNIVDIDINNNDALTSLGKSIMIDILGEKGGEKQQSGDAICDTACQTPWEKKWDLYNTNNSISAIDLDDQGNIYLGGLAYSGGNSNYYITKLDPSGAEVWSHEYGSQYNDAITSLKVYENNLYVAGYSYFDFYLEKFDLDGNQIWLDQWDVGNRDKIYSLDVDSSGDIYMAGVSYVGSYDRFYARKIHPDATEVWGKYWDGGNDHELRSIAVGDNGNAYVSGFGYSGMNDDIYFAGLSSTGSVDWQNNLNLHGAIDHGRAVAVDSENNVYMLGYTRNGANYYDFYLRKVSSDGTVLWVREWDENIKSNWGRSIALDRSDNVYIGGQSDNGSNRDFYVRKIDSEGNTLWTESWDVDNTDNYLNALYVDEHGNIFVAGATNNGTNNDFYIKKFRKDG